MLLAIDIGNTNIVIGGIEDDQIRFEARIATDHIKTSDQYGVEIKNLLDFFGVPLSQVERTASSPRWCPRCSTPCAQVLSS